MNKIEMTFETNLTKDEFASEIQKAIHHFESMVWKINDTPLTTQINKI